jgi:hypothetical protein
VVEDSEKAKDDSHVSGSLELYYQGRLVTDSIRTKISDFNYKLYYAISIAYK